MGVGNLGGHLQSPARSLLSTCSRVSRCWRWCRAPVWCEPFPPACCSPCYRPFVMFGQMPSWIRWSCGTGLYDLLDMFFYDQSNLICFVVFLSLLKLAPLLSIVLLPFLWDGWWWFSASSCSGGEWGRWFCRFGKGKGGGLWCVYFVGGGSGVWCVLSWCFNLAWLRYGMTVLWEWPACECCYSSCPAVLEISLLTQ